jgi:hypothetical protein
MRRFWVWPGLALICGCDGILGIPAPEGRDASQGSTAHGECVVHADCLSDTSNYEPQICSAGQCVPFMHADCPLVLPDDSWVDDLRVHGTEPLIIGVFAPLSWTSIVTATSNVYELALNELSANVGGVPVSGGARPVVALVCHDHYSTVERLDAVVDHLVEVVRVPAVLSMLSAGDLRHAFERSFDRHVFYWNALDADPSLRALITDGLLWHVLPGFDNLAKTYEPLLERTIRYLVRTQAIAVDQRVKVALITTSDHPSLSTLGAELTRRLVFNGKSTADNQKAGDFLAVQIESSVGKSAPPDYGPAVAALREFRPNVVIAAAGEEFFSPILPALEQDVRPFYLLSPTHFESLDRLYAFEGLQEFKTRALGVRVSLPADVGAYVGFRLRFDTQYGYDGTVAAPHNAYDAAYYLLYSAAAAPSVWPLTGSDLTWGMRRLLSGPEGYEVGPSAMEPAMQALAMGSTITLNGVMGPPNFDTQTGVRSGTGSVWCFDSNNFARFDALRLDDAGELVGTFPCWEF